MLRDLVSDQLVRDAPELMAVRQLLVAGELIPQVGTALPSVRQLLVAGELIPQGSSLAWCHSRGLSVLTSLLHVCICIVRCLPIGRAFMVSPFEVHIAHVCA